MTAESGSPWYDPDEAERAEVIVGRSAAWGVPYRAMLPEAYAGWAERTTRHYWRRRPVVAGWDGWPAGDGWQHAGLPRWVPITRWVEALIFDAQRWSRVDDGWEYPEGDVWVDEHGALCGVWFGYPTRAVVTVEAGDLL